MGHPLELAGILGEGRDHAGLATPHALKDDLHDLEQPRLALAGAHRAEAWRDYEAALDAARAATAHDTVHGVTTTLPELVEAAARCGERERGTRSVISNAPEQYYTLRVRTWSTASGSGGSDAAAKPGIN